MIQRIGCMEKDEESGREQQRGACGGFGKGNFRELFKAVEEYEKSIEEAKQPKWRSPIRCGDFFFRALHVLDPCMWWLIFPSNSVAMSVCVDRMFSTGYIFTTPSDP